MTNRWNVAILQMDVVYGQPEQNRAKLRAMTESLLASGERTDVLLLPELWDTAYDLRRLDEIADEEGTAAKAVLQETAQRLGGYVVGGSIAERIGKDVYNTSYVFDRQGQMIGRYAKVHLFRLMHEDSYLAAGDGVGLYNMDGFPTGLVICYDIRFPEWVRTYALKVR